MSFDGDSSVASLTVYDRGDLPDALPSFGCKIGAVELKVYARKIDRYAAVPRGVEHPRKAAATDKPTRAVNARFMISLSRRLKSAAISTTRPSVALDAHSLFLVDRARPGSAAPVAVDPAAFVLVP